MEKLIKNRGLGSTYNIFRQTIPLWDHIGYSKE